MNGILINAAMCRKCETVIVSLSKDEIEVCNCGKIMISGGRSSLERLESEGNLIELSIIEDENGNTVLADRSVVIK